MEIRVIKIKNIWRRRACIIPLYAGTVMIIIPLVLGQIIWNAMKDLWESVKCSIADSAVDIVSFHMGVAKRWRGK